MAGNIKSGVKIFNVTGTASTMDSIDGVLHQAVVASGETVNAGDFVSFINNNISSQQLISNSYSGTAFSAALLSDTTFFVSYVSGSSYYLYGVVVTVGSDGTLTKGDPVQISSSNAGKNNFVIALNSTKVFIAHSYGSKYYLYGTVCTISGTTITSGTTTSISTTYSNVSYKVRGIALSSSKVLLCHEYSSKYALTLCNVSGTTITVSSTTSGLTGGFPIGMYTISSNNVFVVSATATSNADNFIYGTIININGTTLTAVTSTTLASGYSICSSLSDDAPMVKIDDDKYLLVHNTNKGVTTSDYAIVKIIQVTDTSISILSSNNLKDISNFDPAYDGETNRWAYQNVFKISGNRYGIATGIDGYTCSYIEFFLNSDYTIRKVSDWWNDSITCYGGTVISLSNGNNIYLYQTDSGSSASVYAAMLNQNVATAANIIDIYGIAKTSGSAGNTIEVYVPN